MGFLQRARGSSRATALEQLTWIKAPQPGEVTDHRVAYTWATSNTHRRSCAMMPVPTV